MQRGYIMFSNRVLYTCMAEALLPELFKALKNRKNYSTLS